MSDEPYVVHRRGWPGRKTVRVLPVLRPQQRLTERSLLLLVVAAEAGVTPQAFGLGAYVVATGPSIREVGVVVADELPYDERFRIADETWEAPLRTPSGFVDIEVTTVSEFYDPRSGTFQRVVYAGAGTFVGIDLARTFTLPAEYVVERNGANTGSVVVWLPGWGRQHDRNRIKRVSPHRPPLYVRSRPRGARVEFAPCEKGYGKRTATGLWRGEFVDLSSLANALFPGRSARVDEIASLVEVEAPGCPLAVSLDPEGAALMIGSVLRLHRLALALDALASRWGNR
jgi:hypothetical protein